MSRVADLVAPARLGRDFRLLVGASWLSNLGDGITLAAGPLLLASLTQDAFVVALGATVQWLAPLLFALWAGALTDRLDRRRLVLAVNLARTLVLVVLTLAIVTDHVGVPVVLASLFLLGVAEVFADNTVTAVIPTLVHRDDLAVANARLMTAFVTMNELLGPPIGAALFAAGWALPFGTEVVLLLAATVLFARIAVPVVAAEPGAVHREIVAGVRWSLRQPAVRALLVTAFMFNITFGASWSVLVLYSSDHLGLGEIGFGLLTTVSAVGGLLGTLGYGWLSRRISLGNLMRIGLVVETLTQLSLALTSTGWVAMAILFVFGIHSYVWGTTNMTILQRVVPHELMGRVGSVDSVWNYAGLVIGSLLGGVLAQHWGITAPFWFGFAGSAVFIVAIWRSLRHLDESRDGEAHPG